MLAVRRWLLLVSSILVFQGLGWTGVGSDLNCFIHMFLLLSINMHNELFFSILRPFSYLWVLVKRVAYNIAWDAGRYRAAR